MFSTDQRLEFPTFHPQTLTATHKEWRALNGFGRIRIVISEGIQSDISNFQRIAPVVSFSIAHAPRLILEASGIAWPITASMQKVQMVRKRMRDSADMSLDDPPLHAEIHTISPTK